MQVHARVVVKADKLESVAAKIPGAANYIAELAADTVEHGAKARVPVRTGALRNSITKAGHGNTWIVTALMHYAGYVEFGTRKMAAQPYLRPALEDVNWSGILRAFFRRIGL